MISRNDWSGTEKKLPARMISQNDYSEGLDRFFGGKMINHSCGTVLYSENERTLRTFSL
jgi:hypothetical protein